MKTLEQNNLGSETSQKKEEWIFGRQKNDFPS